ncbi:MAG: hypothetical protein H0U66_06560 [Gemmatimonadaceae bacterium]|nr:hypothetical protein [Gemmatimonadaceae bacterium]
MALLAHAQGESHPERASTDDTDSAGHYDDICATGANMQARNELRSSRRLVAGVSSQAESVREKLLHAAPRAVSGT